MKKLLVSLVALSVFAVQAAEIRFGSAVVAGRDKLGEAAFKLGMMSGNMMVGGFLQGALAEAPKKVTTYALVFDTETMKPDIKKVEACDKSPKLGRGELLKTSVCPKALAEICALEPVAAEMTEKEKLIVADLTELSSVLKLDDSGLSAWADIAVKPDSALIEEEQSLPADMLAFAGKNALFAAVASEDAPGGGCSIIRKIFDVFKAHGFRLDCVTVAGEGEDAFVTLDPKLIKSTIEANSDVFAAYECDTEKRGKLKRDLEALKAEYESGKSSGGRVKFMIKGFESAYTPQERFAATLPELADKRVFSASVFSYYSILKALAPHVPTLKSTVAMLPGESKGAIAVACFDDKTTPEKGSYVVRVSADEIRSLGMASGVVMAAMMSGEVEDDEIDDEDED